MKQLKNYEKTIAGIKYKLFTVIKNNNTKLYCYYLNQYFTDNVGDTMIYKSKRKSKVLNRYTLTVSTLVLNSNKLI